MFSQNAASGLTSWAWTTTELVLLQSNKVKSDTDQAIHYHQSTMLGYLTFTDGREMNYTENSFEMPAITPAGTFHSKSTRLYSV